MKKIFNKILDVIYKLIILALAYTLASMFGPITAQSWDVLMFNITAFCFLIIHDIRRSSIDHYSLLFNILRITKELLIYFVISLTMFKVLDLFNIKSKQEFLFQYYIPLWIGLVVLSIYNMVETKVIKTKNKKEIKIEYRKLIQSVLVDLVIFIILLSVPAVLDH